MIKALYFLVIVAVMQLLTSVTVSNNETNNLVKKLTGKKWMFGEIRFLENNTMETYDENGHFNTQNFQKDFVIFYKDHTGEYSNGVENYKITSWKITDVKKIKLEYVIAMESPLTVYWDNISLKSNSIQYSEYYRKANGTNVMGYGNRKAIY